MGRETLQSDLKPILLNIICLQQQKSHKCKKEKHCEDKIR